MKKNEINFILSVSSTTTPLEELFTCLSCSPTYYWNIGEKRSGTEQIATENSISYKEVLFCDWGEDIEGNISAILELVRKKRTEDIKLSLYITMYTKKCNPWIQLTSYHTELLGKWGISFDFEGYTY